MLTAHSYALPLVFSEVLRPSCLPAVRSGCQLPRELRGRLLGGREGADAALSWRPQTLVRFLCRPCSIAPQ